MLKKFLLKHSIVSLLSSILLLIIFYIDLMDYGESLDLQYFLIIYLYILLGYFTVGTVLVLITDKASTFFNLNLGLLITIKIVFYVSVVYLLFQTPILLFAPLIYLLFEVLIMIWKTR